MDALVVDWVDATQMVWQMVDGEKERPLNGFGRVLMSRLPDRAHVALKLCSATFFVILFLVAMLGSRRDKGG
jgi:hypothetical protein